MSPVRLNGSTSGYTELDAPAVAGNNNIKLPTGNGSAYQVVRNGATAGSLEFTDKIVSGTAVASTSGTSIDFTGIPSWVKRVTVMFDQVSTNGTSNPIIQLGTSGGIQATNYRGLAAYVTGAGAQTATQITTGFVIWNFNNTAAAVGQGSAIFNILDSATGIWTMQSCTARSDTNWVSYAAGSKTLSGTLDRVRITTVNGTDTFDAGLINILYE